MLVQSLSGRGWHQSTGAADEKLRAKVILEVGEVMAERRCGHMQVLCRPRERAVFMNGGKVSKLTRVHDF